MNMTANTQLPPEDLMAYKATNRRYAHPCHFGDYEAAKAWAGEGGSVEVVTLKAAPDLHAVGEQFKQVETLNGGGVYAANDGTDYIIVTDYADEILLNLKESYELRDWLNKALP